MVPSSSSAAVPMVPVTSRPTTEMALPSGSLSFASTSMLIDWSKSVLTASSTAFGGLFSSGNSQPLLVVAPRQVSEPDPPPMLLMPLPPPSTSLPAPPMMRSSPESPVMTSSSPPPEAKSFPPPP